MISIQQIEEETSQLIEREKEQQNQTRSNEGVFCMITFVNCFIICYLIYISVI
ncbi:hypothetical protein pb186bvf_016752 [Paramecium bursaria]